MEISTQKFCKKCGTLKLTSDFHPKAQDSDKFDTYCKTCRSAMNAEYRKKRREDAAKIGEINQKARDYRVTNSDNTRKAGRISEQKRRSENPEGMREAYRQWVKNNPEKVKAKAKAGNAKRRARLRNAGGDFTAKEWKALCDKFEGVCLCCGEAKPLTADHVIPLAKGGTNDIGNIQPLCLICNLRKSTKTIDYRPAEALA